MTFQTIQTSLGSTGCDQKLKQSIKSACDRVGVNFSYMMEKAALESSLKPDAKAKTSSATGLFQFTEQSWLQMVKSHGAKHGMANAASAIKQNPQTGKLEVASMAQRSKILDMRKDPYLSTVMAGEYAKQNAIALKQKFGDKIGKVEMYFSHFFGASGAAKFLNAMRSDPNKPAAPLMAQAAKSNPGVFYEAGTGRAKSLKEIYQHFAGKFKVEEGATSKGIVSGKGAELREPVTAAVSDLVFRTKPQKTAAKPLASVMRGQPSAHRSPTMQLQDIKGAGALSPAMMSVLLNYGQYSK